MTELVERIKLVIGEKFAPAVDVRAPYAKVMLDHAARAALAEIEAAGLAIVPKEPTEAMIEAHHRAHWESGVIAVNKWKAMLAAAPKAGQ